MQDPDLAAAMLEEIRDAGLAGVEIGSSVNGLSLHDPRFDGFWAQAERLGTAVFVHGLPAPGDRVPGPATATFGVGLEGALAASAIIAGGVAAKYPGLRIAFSHGAGGFPLMLTRAQWFWGRTWNEEPPPPESQRPEAAPWFAPHGPIELARRFYYDSLVFDRRAIRYLADMLGTGRLLVGSDFPAMPREDPIAATLRSMGLSDSELSDVLWRNCFRFLGVAQAIQKTARGRGRSPGRSRSGRPGCCSRCSATTGGSAPSRCRRRRSWRCWRSSGSATPPRGPRCPG